MNVERFDENDNGELFSGIDHISKIAFDNKYLLIEQSLSISRTDKIIYHYLLLYNFDTEKKEEVQSFK